MFEEKFKTEVQKEPEEIKEEPKTPDFLLEKDAKEKILEIPEIGEIKYFEKKVKFPERIVEETGEVKGYIRKTIPWEEIEEKIKKGKDEKSYERDHRTKNVLRAFTDDEFPTVTFNHCFNLMHGKVTKAEESLKQNKVLLQKLFNFKEKKYEMESPSLYFVSVKENKLTPISKIINEFPIQDKGNELFVDKKNKLHLGYLYSNDPKYKELTPMGSTDNEYFNFQVGKQCSSEIKKQLFTKDFYSITTPSSGLSVSTRGLIWGGNTENVIFGFGGKNKIFQNYIIEVKKIYDDLLPQIYEIESELLKDTIRREHTKPLSPTEVERKYKIELGLQKLKKNSFEDYHRYLLCNLHDIGPEGEKEKSRGDSGALGGEYYSHPRIPIVLNHPDIPELRWCYADYASIPTKKGLNIIKMIT
tara:strand:- start:305 stop:1549 length:1245 start_codon:yes stop_codon:yes gene_type:complete